MSFLDEISARAGSCEQYARDYVRYVARLLENLDYRSLTEIARILEEARERGKKIFLIGNGGSAATASHFAQDLALGARARNRPIFKTLCLTDNVSSITALANDRGYEEVFKGQMEGMFEPGDVLLVFSASGNSDNVLEAIQYARERGGIAVGVVGFDGGKARELCQACLHIPTDQGEYGPVEAIHVFVTHILANYLRTSSGQRRGVANKDGRSVQGEK